MNTKRSLVSLLVLSSITLAPALTMANPTSTSIYIGCPGTQLSAHMITNFGGYVAGYGQESILSQTMNVYFLSQSLPTNVPTSLLNYSNAATSYDSTTGKVICSYQSSIATEPFFSVAYKLTNGRGGAVLSQSNNEIGLTMPLGLKA